MKGTNKSHTMKTLAIFAIVATIALTSCSGNATSNASTNATEEATSTATKDASVNSTSTEK